MIYFGPGGEAPLRYFEKMGWEKKDEMEGMTMGDWLVSLSDENAREGSVKRGWEGRVMRTPGEFASFWERSEEAEINRRDIRSYLAQFQTRDHSNGNEKEMYKKSVRLEQSTGVRNGSPYMISLPMQMRLVMKRRWRILKGGLGVVGLNLA